MASLLPSSLSAAFHAARSYLTPTLKSSGLAEGQLSPDEFVRAGDYLIRMAPAWHWERGDVGKAKSYLPPDKQFLVTKGVPCRRRVRALLGKAGDTGHADREVRLENTGGSSEPWFEPAVAGRSPDASTSGAGDDDVEELPGIAAVPESAVVVAAAGVSGAAPAASAASASAPAPAAAAGKGDDDDEYGDLSAFMDRSLIVHDPAAVGGGMASSAPPAATASAGSAGPAASASLSNSTAGIASASHGSGAASGAAGGEDELRLYDLCLVYDNVYRTPRVYLKGYTEGGAPLGADAMLEDVMQDYVSRTATIEAHPHLGGSSSAAGSGSGGAAGASDGAAGAAAGPSLPSHHFVSIHPCRHAQAMKRIIESMSEGASSASASSPAGGAGASEASASAAAGSPAAPAAAAPALVSVEMYDFIFLKFVATMMPTLEYDNTLAVSGGSVGR